MGDGRFSSNSKESQAGEKGRFDGIIPDFGDAQFGAPPAGDGKKSVAADAVTPPPAPPADKQEPRTAPGVGGDDTKISLNATNLGVAETPPTYKEALEYRRAEISDLAAERDRNSYRIGQLFTNSALACGFARWIEPATAWETSQLTSIRNTVNAGGLAPGQLSGLARDRQYINDVRTFRGRWKGPLMVAGVTVADAAVDQVLFPNDQIKMGTIAADFVGAAAVMFGQTPWRYKAACMVGLHATGRIVDHFLQSGERTNAGKPVPAGVESRRIQRALEGVTAPVDPATIKPVYQAPNSDLVNKNAVSDQQSREQNAAEQRKNQDEAQRRFQEWQEALRQWRLANPGGQPSREAEFMRDWYKKNR
jgi:hypothetical protein